MSSGLFSLVLIVSQSLIVLQVLMAHENEVWFVQFSNSGKYLATASSDCTAIIWKVNILDHWFLLSLHILSLRMS